MKCPACQNELTARPAGEIVVDVCDGGCGGLWFDNFELRRIDAAGVALLRNVWRSEAVTVDFTRKRQCPRCAEQAMLRRYFSRQRAVEIDECPSCGGLWLDAGELERILAELQPQDQAAPLLIQSLATAVRTLRPAAAGPLR